MSNQPDDELFGRALDLPANERAAFLAGECANDDARRARLESLLRAHDAAGDFFASPLAPDTTAVGTSFGVALLREEAVGEQIDRFKLIEKLGEGGCGVVYLAEQQEPVRRSVALKVIKLGMDTHEVIARFEAERQALALMDHPGIARVLDAGATAAGRPYFVMELVRGVPITRYCDDHQLGTPQRLRLFIEVCRAVQHAHQKGIIHRDLKPSNILVALHEEAPIAKVIDFGIAKATHGRLTDQAHFTAVGQFLGTPAYMSPEQAASDGLDVDTRTDIYSLGVLLYEMLTGRLPFEPPELQRCSLDEVRRQIREREPPLPSTRLRTLNRSDLAATAARHQLEPERLINSVRGDLDWVLMKCLEKDRTRRYDSATALALDLQRHLDHEPVSAAAPGTAYVLGKFIRRHRVAFAAGSLVAAALVIGLAVSTYLFLQERQMLARARYAEQKAVDGFRAALRQQATTARAMVAQPATRAEMLEALADFYAANGDPARAEVLRAESRALRGTK